MRQRRKARAVALQVLYEIDLAGHAPDKVLERELAEAGLSEENNTFVIKLVQGVNENREAIDSRIRQFASAWPIEQLPIVDRNILRLAIFEVLFDNEVSHKVAINEAVELAKNFGSDNSAKFVNGVLGSVSTFATNKGG
ncbi:MAG: transcription antitermination factor NusB [Chloroflexi bacterium]|nr:transcription antitermination factor NusB [Chloroflexota bacterium]